MAWLAGWSYRKEITITGETGAGTDYQVSLDIGDASGGDFHLEGNCTNFPQDIAVTDNDETTLLDFWIEDIAADPLKMWVEVADDLGTNKTIYVYYGKSGATTNSDIEATMIFGDDFSGATIDTTTRWNSYIDTGCSITLSSGEAVFMSDNANVKGHSAVLSKSSFGVDNILESRLKFSETGVHASRYPTLGFGAYEGAGSLYLKTQTAIDDSIIFMDGTSGGNIWQYRHYVNGSETSTNGQAISTTYKKFTIERYDTNKARWLIDGAQVKAETTTVADSTQIALGVDSLTSTGTSAVDIYMTVDYVFVRKYNATEPDFSSAGSEETAVTQATTLLHGKIRIKDSTTTLADGKVQIQDTVTNLVDGLVKVQDTATGLSDGLLAVQDKATGLVDGKVQIQDITTNLVDGKVIISLVSAGTDQADGKIQIKDITTDIVDGLIKVKDSVTGLADGKIKVSNIGSNIADGLIQIKDTVTNLADGKIIINIGETSTNLFNGLLRIKDKATGIVDGLLRIIEKPINLADSKVIVADDFNGPFTATITDSQEYTAVITSTQEYTATITDTQEYTAVIS